MSERFYYITSDSIQYLLNDDVHVFFMEEQGFGLPAVNVISDRTPYRQGETQRGLYLKPRSLLLGLAIAHDSDASWRAYDDQFLRNLSPFRDTSSLGTLRRVTGDGRTRDIDCWLVQYEKDSRSRKGPFWGTRVLKFVAPDPFFYDPTQKTESLSMPAGGGFSFPLSWPVSFAATNIDGYIHPQNTGDVETWPTITVTGPCDSLTLTNDTTGKTFSVTQAQDPGDYITIDMEEGTVTWYDASAGTTTSILENVSASSEFWPLARGTNDIHVEATGASGGTITLAYYLRYISA